MSFVPSHKLVLMVINWYVISALTAQHNKHFWTNFAVLKLQSIFTSGTMGWQATVKIILFLSSLPCLVHSVPLDHFQSAFSHDEARTDMSASQRARRSLVERDDSSALNVTSTTPILNFQVSQPVLAPSSPKSAGEGCVITQVLMEHVFRQSYYKPFIGELIPAKLSFKSSRSEALIGRLRYLHSSGLPFQSRHTELHASYVRESV